MNEIMAVFSDKAKKSIYLVLNLLMLALMLLLSGMYLKGTLIVNGGLLNLKSCLAWVFGVAEISGKNFFTTILKLILGVSYVVIFVFCCRRIVNTVTNTLPMFRKGISEKYMSEATDVIYGNLRFIFLMLTYYLIGSSLMLDVLLEQGIKVSVVAVAFLLIVLRGMKGLLFENDKNNIATHVSYFIEATVELVILFVVLNMLSGSLLSNLISGLMTVSGLSKAAMAVLLSGLAKLVVAPVISMIIIFECRIVLDRVTADKELQEKRWHARHAWKVSMIWAFIALGFFCVADAFSITDISRFYNDTFTIVERFYNVGKDVYVPLALLSFAGMMAAFCDPITFKKKPVLDNEILDDKYEEVDKTVL